MFKDINNETIHHTPILNWEELSSDGILQIVILSLFTFVNVAGNGIVLVFLCKSCQSPFSLFIKAFATAHIVTALFLMPMEMIWKGFRVWIFGGFLCKLGAYFEGLVFGAAAFMLMSMSFDRYEAICKPMTLTRSVSRCRKLILLSWGVASVVSVPQLFIFLQVAAGKHADGNLKYACKDHGYTAKWQRKVYMIWQAAYISAVPFLFVAVCYIKVARRVWQTSKPSARPNGNSIPPGILRRNTSAERARVKTVKITVCLLFFYMLCYLPYWTLHLIDVWRDNQGRSDIPRALRVVIESLPWFSCCVNPLLCITFDTPFKSLRKICCLNINRTF